MLIVVASIAYASAFAVEGDFYNSNFGSFGDIYWFTVKNLKCSNNFYKPQPLRCTDSESVTEIKGSHVFGYNNELVHALSINGQSINFMPREFDHFFPNIAGLEIANSNLKVIRKRDLSPFSLLQTIIMHGNRLESLDLDAFEGNPQLSYIDLANNDFKHLDPRTFESLIMLKDLDLSSNRCINTRATTPQQLADLHAEMHIKCKSVGNQIADANALQDENTKTEVAKINADIKALKDIAKQLGFEIIE